MCGPRWNVDRGGISSDAVTLLVITRSVRLLSWPSGVQICDRISEPNEDVPVRPAGRQPRLETSVKHEPGYDCVGERPQRRSESGCGRVQSSVTIEFSGELESSTNDAGKRQIYLLVVI